MAGNGIILKNPTLYFQFFVEKPKYQNFVITPIISRLSAARVSVALSA